MSLVKVANINQKFDFFLQIHERMQRDFTNPNLIKKEGIIVFPLVFTWFSQRYRFDKQMSKAIIKEMDKRRLIEHVPFHGIKILRD